MHDEGSVALREMVRYRSNRLAERQPDEDLPRVNNACYSNVMHVYLAEDVLTFSRW